jgi:hypothetical protein
MNWAWDDAKDRCCAVRYTPFAIRQPLFVCGSRKMLPFVAKGERRRANDVIEVI